jgi:hypothetical protein
MKNKHISQYMRFTNRDKESYSRYCSSRFERLEYKTQKQCVEFSEEK